MTKKELLKALEKYPDHMDIFIEKTNDEDSFSLLEKAEVKKLLFVDGELKAKDNVIVLTDEF